MSKDKILVYGAAGYMGQLFLKVAKNKSIPFVLAARSGFSAEYPVRVFGLDKAEEIDNNLKDVLLVINLAGPFIHTNKSLVEACIRTQTHYIDIAGEVPEIETIYQYHQQAQAANIMLMPSAGFGVVPTDIVANLAKAKLPDATSLKIAYVTKGGASRGTLKTVLADINKEGVILEDGMLKPAMPASKTFSFSAKGKTQNLVYNPWRADLFTAQISTGIQNIETYANFPSLVVKMMQGKWLWLRNFILKRLINWLPVGPSAKQIAKGSTICYAEVSNNKGEKASATIYGPEAYQFTAETLVLITKKILNNDFKAGFQTPNLYGEALLTQIPNLFIE